MSAIYTLRQWLNIPADDETLMSRYADTGEEKLLSLLYDRCNKDLFHFLLVMTDEDTAREIAQRTWLKVIERRQRYQPKGRFIAWLFTLARHTLIDEYRKTARFTEEMADIALPENPSSSELVNALPAALARLPFPQREAFCLHQEGFGVQEIANMCDESAETIKSRIRYARQQLQKMLEKYRD